MECAPEGSRWEDTKAPCLSWCPHVGSPRRHLPRAGVHSPEACCRDARPGPSRRVRGTARKDAPGLGVRVVGAAGGSGGGAGPGPSLPTLLPLGARSTDRAQRDRFSLLGRNEKVYCAETEGLVASQELVLRRRGEGPAEEAGGGGSER